MNNPWTKLEASRNGYVLDEDLDAVNEFNRSVSDTKARIVFDALPEPYIGSPDLAKVVFLGLNPGYSVTDPEWHARKDFRGALLLNLNHEPTDYPFYPLDPAFRQSGAGQWWRERTRQLQSESGLDDRTFAKRIMVIEWFPYHSVSFKAPRAEFHSQRYSFQLAREMLGRKLLVRMRSRSLWAKVHPGFGDISSLRNPQCGYVTRGNTDGSVFEEILKALRS
jgi:hypothetical protein